MKPSPFRLHYVLIPVLAIAGMVFMTVAAVPGCTDAQIQQFRQPTTQPVPATQPGATSQPTTQAGPSKQDQVLNTIDTASGYLSTIGQVASLFPGKSATTVGLVVGLLGIAVGVTRKVVKNPPKTVKEAVDDALAGVVDAANAASVVPGAAKVAGEVKVVATVGQAVLNATQLPPNTPTA